MRRRRMVKRRMRRTCCAIAPRYMKPLSCMELQKIVFETLNRKENKMNEMTKEQALEQIEKLKKYVEDKDKVILVPKEVTISDTKFGYSMGIIFNKGRQELSFKYDKRVYVTMSDSYHGNEIECKLTPCEREDCVAGDIVFMGATTPERLRDISMYAIILSEGRHVCAEDNEDVVTYTDQHHSTTEWHKVVEV